MRQESQEKRGFNETGPRRSPSGELSHVPCRWTQSQEVGMRHTQNPQLMRCNLGSAFLCNSLSRTSHWNNLSKTSALGRLSSQSFSRLALILARLALILGFALATAGTVAAQVAPPVGPYGFVLNATFTDASTQGGAAMLGLMTFDGAGNVSGPYQLELGSGGANAPQSISGKFSGTYSMNPVVPPNPVGSGTISLALDIGVNLALDMLIDNRGRTIQLALTGCTGPICDLTGTVVAGVAEIEFTGLPHPIHQGFLDGSTYGLQTTKSSPIPATSIATWTFDAATGSVTIT